MKTDWHTLAENLRRLMADRGIKQKPLAVKAGLHDTAVRDILVGRSKNPGIQTLEPIARALGVAVSDLTNEPGAAELVAGDATPFDPAAVRPGHELVGERDLPVYASAEGGPTGMTVTYDPIEYVKRPEPLMNVRGAFGFYVVGDSMWPRFRSGDLLLVHPTRPPQRHDHVLVMLHDGVDDSAIQALVKVYVGWAGDSLQLEQYNPAGPVPSIPRTKVKGIHKIVGSYEGRS